MKLKTQIGAGYAGIALICLMLLAVIGYHEFVEEPKHYGATTLFHANEPHLTEFAEVSMYAVIPLVLLFGWFFIRHQIQPLDAAARTVDAWNAGKPLPRLSRKRSFDELDRLVSALNGAAERLEIAFAQLHEFTLNASHEIKTPLAVLRGQIEEELREGYAPARASRLEGQLEEIDHIARVLDHLSLLARAETGTLQLQKTGVCMAGLLAELVEDLQVLGSAKKLSVSFDGAPAASISCDRDRIRQVLLILGDNAVKYTPPGGWIRIGAAMAPTGVTFWIWNQGENPSPEEAERLFLRFVRGRSESRAVDGLGLGLSIARSIVEAHGGGIHFDPSPGEGVRVLVLLPSTHTGQICARR